MRLKAISTLLGYAQVRSARIVDVDNDPPRWVCFLQRDKGLVWADARWIRSENGRATRQLDQLVELLRGHGFDAAWHEAEPRRMADRVTTRQWPTRWYATDLEG